MRHLTEILFADMMGYTVLIKDNEFIAIEKRKRLKEVLDKTIPRFKFAIRY
jgi:adenylate cyclase